MCLIYPCATYPKVTWTWIAQAARSGAHEILSHATLCLQLVVGLYISSGQAAACHVLHRYLPNLKHTGYNLRQWAHVNELPDKDDHNFIKRLLYKNIYCRKT